MKLLTRLLLLGVLGCFLAGCGGSGNNLGLNGNKDTGRAVFTVKWPVSTRVIPTSSQSIKISFLQGTNVIASQLIVKPATTATFNNLPLGTLMATATAYPNPDGSGTAQATANVPVTVLANKTVPITLSLASTIVSLKPSVANLDLGIGQSAAVAVTALDKDGNAVLFDASTITWASQNTGVATVNATGRVTAVANGTTNVTATAPPAATGLAGPLVATIAVTVEPDTGIQRLYIADFGHNQIIRIDDITGFNELTFGAFGSNVNQFNGPAGIAVGDDNRIYVVDKYNNRIVRIDDMNGTNWVSFGTQGSAIGQFNNPNAIFVAHDNRIYVADTGNNRIVRMDDMNGTNWVALGAAGSDVNQFNTPNSICVGNNNQIYVADRLNNRIIRMDDMTGANWTTFSSGLSGPSGVFIDADTRIYIADTNNLRIVRINDMSGALLTTFVQSKPLAPLKDPPHDTFGGPVSIFVTPESVLYVGDFIFGSAGGRIAQLFTPADDTNFWPSFGGLSGPMAVFLHTGPATLP